MLKPPDVFFTRFILLGFCSHDHFLQRLKENLPPVDESGSE